MSLLCPLVIGARGALLVRGAGGDWPLEVPRERSVAVVERQTGRHLTGICAMQSICDDIACAQLHHPSSSGL